MTSAAVGARAANIIPSEAVAELDLRTTPSAIGRLDPVRIRMMGGTVRTDVLVDALKLPFVLVPTVNGDNNQQARDKNLQMGHFITGTEAILALLSTNSVPDYLRVPGLLM